MSAWHGVVSPSRGVVSTWHRVVSPSHGVVSAWQGVVSASRGVVSARHGVVSAWHRVVSARRGVGHIRAQRVWCLVPCYRNHPLGPWSVRGVTAMRIRGVFPFCYFFRNMYGGFYDVFRFLNFRPVMLVMLPKKSNYATTTKQKPDCATLCSIKKQPNYAERAWSNMDISLIRILLWSQTD